MKKTPIKPITREELERVAFDICYLIMQSASYYTWEFFIKTQLRFNGNENLFEGNRAILSNSILEASLLFIRKLNSFFTKSKLNREQDDVYAFDFPGFMNYGWFLSKPEMDELSIRVGHITLREARL